MRTDDNDLLVQLISIDFLRLLNICTHVLPKLTHVLDIHPLAERASLKPSSGVSFVGFLRCHYNRNVEERERERSGN